MANIVVLGGTGYAGTAIASEAASRGYRVTAFSRSAPAEPIPGIAYASGSVLDGADLERAIAGAEVAVVALAPTGDLADDAFVRVNAEIAALAQKHGVRLGIVGGAGTLLLEPDGGKVFESPFFPEEFRGFSRTADEVLQALRASDPALDWFIISPPRGFGHYAPGEKTGAYRVGGDVVMSQDAAISGADYAKAFVDEIEQPAHRRARFTVAH